MASNADVLIVGAGPVGLTLAAGLRHHGLSCRIVDKSPLPSDKSKALVLWPRSLEMLEDMGAVAPFLAAGRPAHGGAIYDGRKRLVHLTFEFDSPFPYALMIPQNDTERLLAEHAAGLGVQVERGVELTALATGVAGARATLRRADGASEEIEVPWLVGCDGAHSAVRHLLGVEFEGEAEPNDWVLADVHVQGDLPPDEVTIFFHEEGVLFLFPIRGERFRIVADVGLAASLDHPPDPPLAEVQRLVDERGPGGLLLRDPVWLAGFRIHERKVGHFRHGRVFLAGDSAHIHSPAGGQGMNTGMQDTYNLAWKLALVQRGQARDALLDSYDLERGAVAEMVLRNAGLMTRAATLRNPLAQQLRNRAYALLGSLDVVQHRIGEAMSELAIHYRDSPLSGEHRGRAAHAWLLGGGVRPGERMPDAELVRSDGSVVRLFQLQAGPPHTLFLLAGVEAPAEQVAPLTQIADAVRARWGELVRAFVVLPEEEAGGARPPEGTLRDPAQQLHRRLGAGSPTLVLVRPDGYVGFRSQPASAEALIDHLATYLV